MRSWIGLALVLVALQPASAENWTLNLGAAATTLPDYPGSHRSLVRVLPLLNATYGPRLALSFDDGLRWTAFMSGPVKLGLVGEYRQHDRSTQSAGIPGMGDALEFGGFFEFDTPVAAIEARVRQAVTGYRGLSADLSADTGGEVHPGTKIGAELRMAWAGYRFVESRFGRGVHGRHDLNPDDPDGPHYLSAGLQFAASQQLGGRVDLVAVASQDLLLGYIDSPLIQTRTLRQATLGLRYRFAG